MSLITGKHLIKTYGHDGAAVAAVSDVSFSIESGEFVALMGESGAGKSTLLTIMGAMNAPSSGEYLVDDIPVYDLNPEQRADFRREYLGFVFQSFHLIPYLNVVENVMLPITVTATGRHDKREMALEALDRVGLEGKAKRLPGQISGGEKERVAIARAIVNEPPFLLADEPTGNLDSKTTSEVMGLLQALNEEGATIVMVTHSRQCAEYATRLLTLSDGCLLN